ncbi:MAG: IS21 family transposase [Bacteroidota bacterium]
MNVLKQIIQQHHSKISLRAIARNCGVSRNTVRHYLKVLEEKKCSYEALLAMEDHELGQLLAQGKAPNQRQQQLLAQLPYLAKELHRTGVTRWVLWGEYKEKFPDGYQYSQFCNYLDEWLQTDQATLHIAQKPGDKLYIDFSGKKLYWIDQGSREKQSAEVFVATLGYSQYTYVEACASQRESDVIGAMVNALHFFEGVPEVIVPDNMKTAVIKASKYEPTLNEKFNQLANYYKTAILPARSSKPRDKAWVEVAVKTVYSRIFAPLRNEVFYSLAALNQGISKCLLLYNKALFQGRNYSRLDRFEEEKKTLGALPCSRFALSTYRHLQVLKNAHVRLREDKNYYSVPYRYIGKKVKVVLTRDDVTVYDNFERIAFHVRSYKAHSYSTQKEHLPSHHRFVSDWSAEKFLNWAEGIAPVVKAYIAEVLSSKAYPEQAYRSCVGILSFAKKMGKERLIAACQRAAHYGAYNYKTIEGILHNELDACLPTTEQQASLPLPKHENVRGVAVFQ